MTRLARVKKWLREKNLDAFLVSKAEHYYYLSGFTGTSGCLVVTADLAEDFLITDFRYVEQAQAEAPDYQLVLSKTGLYATLGETLSQAGLQKVGLDQAVISLAIYEKIKKSVPQVTFFPLADPCLDLRKLKDAGELQLLKKAIEISDQAFLHIKELIRPGLTEKEIAHELEFFMKRIGATGPAFEIIVASGKRAALPHGTATSRVLQKGDLVLLDFGAIYQGYHSDLSRTLVLGEPDALQKERYELVGKAQERVIAEIQPGMRASAVDALARQVFSAAGCEQNFGHSLGHGVGLEIHEAPRLGPQEFTILEPGMVVTIEPGLYFSGWGGIRLEDIVVLTSGGCEKLTKAPQIFKV